MAKIATERSLGVVRVRRRQAPARVRFFALEQSMCVQIEADSEDDARILCREMRFEFIALCDG
jgi:hypothetical protein